MTELKPCPFCGGEAHYSPPFNNWTDSHAVICEEGNVIVIGKTKAEAIEAWNTRTPEQAITATLGSGECEQVLTDCDDGLMPPFTAHCSKCGAEWGFTPKFCHNCGSKVVGTRDERNEVRDD